MTRTTLALGMATLLTIGSTASSGDDKPKTNASHAPADLIGGYTIVSGEKYGDKEPAERIEGTTVRFAEDAIIVLDKDKKEVYAQTYKIDASTTPWTITMRSKITPYKGTDEAVTKGLIQKDGDTVKLIYAVPGGDMPTEFKTNSKQLMFVLKNERKASKDATK
jgi:uncharacterized protein (TIGR03067 family)